METQASISAWAEETFGPNRTLIRIAVRADEEQAKLLRAITTESPAHDIVIEAADVVMILANIATRLSIDIDAALIRAPLASYTAAEKDDGTLALAFHTRRLLGVLMLSMAYGHEPGQLSETLQQLIGKYSEICSLQGFHLIGVVNAKMVINRLRTWTLHGSGQGYKASGEDYVHTG